MNATKFITDTSHQHNTSLHHYLKPSTSSTSVVDRDKSNSTDSTSGLSKEGVDGETLDLTTSDNKVNINVKTAGQPAAKKVVVRSRKNKRKSVDIQNYFSSPGG